MVQWFQSTIQKLFLRDTSRKKLLDLEDGVVDIESRRALICAAKHGWLDKFKEPLPPNLIGDQSFPGQLLVAAAHGGQLNVVKIFIRRNKSDKMIDATEMDSQLTGALQAAAKAGHVDVVESILGEGAKFDGQYGLIVLQAAARGGHMDVVKILLKKGVNVVGVAGYEVLHAAATRGHTHIMEILIQNGVDVNIEAPRGGRTALQIAAEKGNNSTVRLLLDKGAVLNGAAVYDVLLASAKAGNTKLRARCIFQVLRGSYHKLG